MAPQKSTSPKGSQGPEVLNAELDFTEKPVVSPEATLETATEQKNAREMAVKFDSKREGAGLSLDVLKDKIEKGVYADKETTDLIAEISESTINRENAEALFAVAGTLLTVARTNGQDIKTPEELLAAVTSRNFPIRPNKTELTAVYKLREVSHVPEVRTTWDRLLLTLPAVKATPQGVTAETAPDTGKIQVRLGQELPAPVESDSRSTLGKMFDYVKENPGKSLLIAGALIAASAGIYTLIRKMIRSSGSDDEAGKDGKEKGSSLTKWLIGGGLATIAGTFAAGRLMDIDSVKTLLKSHNINVDSSRIAQFVKHLSHGEIGAGLTVLWEGVDEKKEYHEKVAGVINQEMSTNAVTGKFIYDLQNKKFAEFNDSSVWDRSETVQEWRNSGLNAVSDTFGPLAGLVGIDSKEDREAALAVKTYFKHHEDTINSQIAINKDETTVGDVLKRLISEKDTPAATPAVAAAVAAGTPAAVVGEEPASRSPAQKGSPAVAESVGVFGALAAANAAIRSAGSNSVAPNVAATPQNDVAVPQNSPEVSGTFDPKRNYDEEIGKLLSQDTVDQFSLRNQVTEAASGNELRSRLIANEKFLSGFPAKEKMTELFEDLLKRQRTLERLAVRAKTPEEREAIEEKRTQILEWKHALTEYLPAHEAAARTYLAAIKSGNTESIQAALAQFVEQKERIAEIFDDAFERDGWTFLEGMLVSQGIPYLWNGYKHYLGTSNLRLDNARYLFGKNVERIMSVARVVRNPSAALRNALTKEPLLELSVIEARSKALVHNIDTFDEHFKPGREPFDRKFLEHYDTLEKQAGALQSQLSRQLAAEEKVFNDAMKRGDSMVAQASMQRLNKISATRAHLEAGIVKDATQGWKVLQGAFGTDEVKKTKIGLVEIGKNVLKNEDYKAGTNKLRQLMRKAIMEHKEHAGGGIKRLLPTKGKLAFFGAQLLVGGYIGSDDQTSFVEAAKRTALMATPIVGFSLDFKQAFTGEEAFTGRKIDGYDRLISAAFGFAGIASDALSIFGIGLAGKSVVTGLKTARGLSAARKAEHILEAGEDIYKTAKATRAFKMAKTARTAATIATIGYLGAQTITLGFEKLHEIDVPKGFQEEILDPLSYQFTSTGSTIDAKIEKLKERS